VLYPADGSVAAHFCTAEVVQSPRHDLVVTAAHCLAGVGAIRFAPGYRGGRTPFGTWSVVASFVDSAWRRAADPDHDFAFLVVAPRHGMEVQALTGAERIGEPGPAIGSTVRVTGYPEGDQSPITCTSTLRRFGATQLEFDCNGYLNGTSGSAFLQHIDPATGLGTIVGVIGGYEQGGDYPQVSYAAAFGPAAMALYRSAERAS
jgi:V8-like Glu-specific endopeptidase